MVLSASNVRRIVRRETCELKPFLNIRKGFFMATVASDKDWNKYVRDNNKSSTMSYPIENGILNEPIYKDTTLKNEVAQVSTGDTINITTKSKTTIGRSSYAQVRFNGKTGYLKVSSIRKPTMGRAGGSGAMAEQKTLDVTQATINNLKGISKISGNEGIPVEVPGIGFFLGINAVEKVADRIHGREAKSDFVLKNSLNRGVLFISHKAGSGARAFNQYGGISEKSGSIDDNALLYNHPEVQSFLNRLYELYQDSINGRTITSNPFNSSGKITTSGVIRKISDTTLINQSVYGPSFGGTYGPDNVHLIGQGNFIFTPVMSEDEDVYFKLSFSSHMALNGDLTDFANDNSEYRAVLLARTGDRSTKTSSGDLPRVRVGIFPKANKPQAVSI